MSYSSIGVSTPIDDDRRSVDYVWPHFYEPFNIQFFVFFATLYMEKHEKSYLLEYLNVYRN